MSGVAAEVRDLRMRYGATDVLNGVDFDVRTGEVVALLGPNGAGKTTTIEILEGFRARSAGRVSVLGTDPERGGEQWRARLGLARGGVDLRHSVTYGPDLIATIFFPLLQVTVLLLMRGHHVPGTTFSLGSLYVVGRLTLMSVNILIGLVILPVGGLTAISGIFYPITHLAGWLQAIGQVFPMYWIGLGMRAALLPPHLAAVEIGGSWRLPLVFAALALWSALGLASAPPVLRRMARRESGSRLAARRERAMVRAT